MEKRELIEQLVLFAKKRGANFTPELMECIFDVSTMKMIKKGTILASVGDDTQLAGIVLSGILRSSYTNYDGDDVTRGFMPAGYMCMDEGFFGYKERIWTIEALEDSTIILFEIKDIRNLIKEKVEFKDLWISLLESTVPYKYYRESGFLVETAKERYLHFKELYPDVVDRVPQKHLATYLGITPESLSRIKHSLKEAACT